MKKILIFIFVLSLIMSYTCCSVFSSVPEKDNENFAVLKIPFPENIKDNDSWRTVARFKDSGQAITLSAYYNGYVFATVPAAARKKDRKATDLCGSFPALCTGSKDG